MGHWNAGVGQAADPGADPRHDPERNLGCDKRKCLFAAAPEDEGIAALQTKHALALARQFDKTKRDVALPGRWLAAALAGKFADRGGPGEGQNALVDQRVVDHHIRLIETMNSQQRKQSRLAWSRSRQPDPPRFEGRQIAENSLHRGHSRHRLGPG